jgi:hypothetical protein
MESLVSICGPVDARTSGDQEVQLVEGPGWTGTSLSGGGMMLQGGEAMCDLLRISQKEVNSSHFNIAPLRRQLKL